MNQYAALTTTAPARPHQAERLKPMACEAA
jgi:hypothetical protein